MTTNSSFCPLSSFYWRNSIISHSDRLAAQDGTQQTGMLPSAERERIQLVFDKHCSTSGTLSPAALEHALHDVNGGVLPEEELKTIVEGTKLDTEGNVMSTAFLDGIAHWYLTSTLPGDGSPASPNTQPQNQAANPSETREYQLVTETFNRYSKSQEGVVIPDELREMMADLNSGIYPTDQEVRHVMWFADTRQRGCLDIKEFESAVTFWYIHTMEERERAKSHCCTIL